MVDYGLTTGVIGALAVTVLFVITLGFFILNKLGFVRNEETEEDVEEIDLDRNPD